MLPRLLYGVAYYLEYMPEDRLELDMRMLKDAGFNLIRVAESTWSTWEPREGEFDFMTLHRVLGAAQRHGISVIIGTPTYAIPPGCRCSAKSLSPQTRHSRCRRGACSFWRARNKQKKKSGQLRLSALFLFIF